MAIWIKYGQEYNASFHENWDSVLKIATVI